MKGEGFSQLQKNYYPHIVTEYLITHMYPHQSRDSENRGFIMAKIHEKKHKKYIKKYFIIPLIM